MRFTPASLFPALLALTVPAAWPGEASCQPCDVINLRDKSGNDDSVVLLDGLRSGTCLDDQVLRAGAAAQVGDMGATVAGCNSEIQVFSSGHSMAMHGPEDAWQDGCGDAVDVALQPPLRVPVRVWLVRPDSSGEADAALTHAAAVYDQNKTGIAFAIQSTDVSGSVAANQATALGCTSVGQLPQTGFYEPGRVNVYYVNEPWPVSAFYTGENCESNRSVIFIGPAANLATLAHEFGHAFSLFGGKKEGGHTEESDGFDANNVMAGGGPSTRSHFSLGQAFRFNVDPRSWLNANGLRAGPTHPCPARQPPEPDPRCPRLELDWARP